MCIIRQINVLSIYLSIFIVYYSLNSLELSMKIQIQLLLIQMHNHLFYSKINQLIECSLDIGRKISLFGSILFQLKMDVIRRDFIHAEILLCRITHPRGHPLVAEFKKNEGSHSHVSQVQRD